MNDKEIQRQVAQEILDEFDRRGRKAVAVTIGPEPLTATIHTNDGDLKVMGSLASQLRLS